MKVNKYFKKRRGMNIVELAVVMAISGMLIVGILKSLKTP